MKAFAFRLERVLHWRVTSLKLEEARLDQIRSGLELARQEKEALSQALLLAGHPRSSETVVTGGDLHTLSSYKTRLDKEIVIATKKMATIADAAAKQMVVVSHSDRDVRLLERLRSRRQTEWDAEANREAEGLLSDFSGSQWLRASRNAPPGDAGLNSGNT